MYKNITHAYKKLAEFSLFVAYCISFVNDNQ